MGMQYLHTMVRVKDIDESLDFYCNKLGLVEMERHESEKGRFTLIFLAAPDDVDVAKAGWRSSGRRTAFRWNCCSAATPSRRRSRGHRWRIPEAGRGPETAAV